MMTQRKGVQLNLFSTTLEDVVPADHFLRRLDAAIDWRFIYDELAPFYSVFGAPSIDPVIVVKALLIGFLYGINSERRLYGEELPFNVAYRWFLGLTFEDKMPDHSAVSQLRRRKFNDADLFKKLFQKVLKLCVEAGLVNGKLLITDSTHVKANASKTSKITVEIERKTNAYFERLDEYEKVERERLNMPAIERKKPENEIVEQTKSATDEGSGWLSRPGKPNGFHYLSHQTLDAENGIIVDVEVTAGNTSDNIPYIEQVDRSKETLQELNIEVSAVCADSGYDTALIHAEMEKRGLTIFTPEKALSDSSKVEYRRNSFIYDEKTDTFTCPAGETLTLKCLQRTESGVFREYRTTAKACENCPNRDKCLAPTQKSRKLQVNILQKIVDAHHSRDGSPEYNNALKRRQIWCEGTFAHQKARHNLGQMVRRGLRAAKDHCLLSACALNLKRLIKGTVRV
jgi:transposase